MESIIFYFKVTFWLIFISVFSQSTFAVEADDFVEFTAKSGGSYNTAFVIPFPQKLLSIDDSLSLTRGSSKVEFNAESVLLWPESKSIRSLLIKVPNGIIAGANYRLDWSTPKQNSIGTYKDDVVLVVEIELSKTWLANILYAPLIVDDKRINYWFDNAYLNYASFVTDEDKISASKRKLPNLKTPSPWLYDRPFTLYQLYLKTADNGIKAEAKRAAQFFLNNINKDGYFALKKGADLKYLTAQGLLMDYIFHPRASIRNVIKKFYRNSLSWPTQYRSSAGFWTERHLSIALAAAINYWEMTSSQQAKQRIDNLISGTISSLYMYNDKQSGCVAHHRGAHEGGAAKDQVCSPWMNALLTAQLWRYYQLTGDVNSKLLIKAFSYQVVNHGTYIAEGNHIRGLTIPYYLSFFEPSIYEDDNPWADMQHACDVAGMVATGTYLAKTDNENIEKNLVMLDKLLMTCRYSMGMKKKTKTNNWAIAPLRKFNWWFSSTGNLSWLLQQNGYYSK